MTSNDQVFKQRTWIGTVKVVNAMWYLHVDKTILLIPLMVMGRPPSNWERNPGQYHIIIYSKHQSKSNSLKIYNSKVRVDIISSKDRYQTVMITQIAFSSTG